MQKQKRQDSRFGSVDAARSANMRAIRSRDTAPELAVRSALHRAGFRFRLHRSDLPSVPDLVFPKYRKVIFVHGCFWHSHSCKRGGRVPKTNRPYWSQKLARNRQRDNEARRQLRKRGWGVLTVWECQTKQIDRLLPRLRRFLENA